jgi:hypothetical protein
MICTYYSYKKGKKKGEARNVRKADKSSIWTDREREKHFILQSRYNISNSRMFRNVACFHNKNNDYDDSKLEIRKEKTWL